MYFSSNAHAVTLVAACFHSQWVRDNLRDRKVAEAKDKDDAQGLPDRNSDFKKATTYCSEHMNKQDDKCDHSSSQGEPEQAATDLSHMPTARTVFSF